MTDRMLVNPSRLTGGGVKITPISVHVHNFFVLRS